MSAGSIFVAGCRANANLSPLLGARICPADGVARRLNRPYVEYELLDNTPDYDLGGTLQGYQALIQARVVADSAEEVDEIRVLFPAAAKGFRGTLAGSTVDDAEAESDGDEPQGPYDGTFIGAVNVSLYYL